METALFIIFGLAAIVAAITVVYHSNPVMSAISLVACLFCIALIYVLLNAHLIAVLQILVYAGAVMVLFLFVIMMLNLRDEELEPRKLSFGRLFGCAVGLVVLFLVVAEVAKSKLPAAAKIAAEFGTVKHVGLKLFSKFLLPFEVTSILLLVAIVGAVMMARRKT